MSGFGDPTPSQNPPSTQTCPTPTTSKAECYLEDQERRKKLELLEDKLEWKKQNDPTAAYCDWLRSELTNLSKESFEDF